MDVLSDDFHRQKRDYFSFLSSKIKVLKICMIYFISLSSYKPSIRLNVTWAVCSTPDLSNPTCSVICCLRLSVQTCNNRLSPSRHTLVVFSLFSWTHLWYFQSFSMFLCKYVMADGACWF